MLLPSGVAKLPTDKESPWHLSDERRPSPGEADSDHAEVITQSRSHSNAVRAAQHIDLGEVQIEQVP